MKRIITFVAAALLSVATFAQSIDGNRVIVEKNDGSKEVFAIGGINNITFAEVGDVSVSMSVTKTTDASVRLQFTPTAGCKKYYIACFPSSQAVKADSLRQYIINHHVAERTIATRYEIIDLQAATDYTVATLGFDEYGIACDTKTLAVRTSAGEVQQPAQVGDYFYADGTWSTDLKTNKTVIGIVFSTSTSAAEKAKGWSHGTVMALRNAGEKQKWNTMGEGANENGASSYASASSAAVLADVDGYSHTQTLLSKQSATVSYPAAQCAANYDVSSPSSTSGWYLPAVGQTIQIAENLGGIAADSLKWNANSTGQGTWNLQGSVCVSNINAKLSMVTSADVDLLPTDGALYLGTSSDCSLQSAYYMFINGMAGINSVGVYGYYKDSDLYTVRPVLSF